MASEHTFMTQDTAAFSLPAIKTREAVSWGWLPLITLNNAFGLLLTAVAYNASRNGLSWAIALFWLSLIIIFVPNAVRLSLSTIARKERIGLIVGIGLAFYLVKVLYTPFDFGFHDEFLHWRTATDIMLSGRLFTPNPILTVSPLYPGLEIISTAFAQLSGLTVMESGLIMLGVVRLMFMLGLYLFYEQVGFSPQIGAMAALLYMGNSNFIYFDSQFSYESLSLPLATAVLYFVLLQQRVQIRGFVRLLLLVLPAIITISITHHLTAYVVAGILFLWAAVTLVVGKSWRQALTIATVASLTLGIVGAWTTYTGNVAESYLTPVINGGLREFIGLLLNEETGRELFRGAAGLTTPIWERILGILSVLFVLGVLPFGLLEIWRAYFSHPNPKTPRWIQVFMPSVLQAWYRLRNNSAAVTFAGLVLLHPLMLAFRFTSAGWEIANRSSEFVFWAVAFILALGALGLRRYLVSSRAWTAIFAIWVTVIFLGGSVSGWPHWARLPGSYMVSADVRSIEPQGISAATWAGDHLDPRDRIAADRINTLLLATYGYLTPVTHQYDNLYIIPVFFSDHIGPVERDLVERVNLRYALVDDRITTALPTVGVYFEGGEPGADDYTEPPTLEVLSKFDHLPGVSRIFDNGHIKIYDVSVLNEPLP